MKYFFSILFLSFTLFTNAQEKEISEVEAFQEELNTSYKDKNTSPLKKKDLKVFKSLPFYPENTNLKVTAKIELTPNSKVFVMGTTTKRKPLYKKYAVATFTINGKEIQLSIYQNQQMKFDFKYKDYLFLPFKDLTNGIETYGGGRYVDVSIKDIKNNTLILDFNKAYNPYCAYNHDYSCPIPPIENHLDIEIKAGVQKGIVFNEL